MRVLAVGNMYPPHHVGGYELVWAAAMDDLLARGDDVLVLTTDHREPGTRPADPAFVHRDLRWYWRDHGWPPFALRERLALERHNAAVFDRLVAAHRPDVVTWWSMGGLSLGLIERARRQGLPAVGFVHDGWMVYGPQRDRWMHGWARVPQSLRRLAGAWDIPAEVDLGAAAEWVFVSEAARRRALQERPLARTAVAPSGISATFVAPRPPRPWQGRLLVVGRLDDRKGPDVAVRAVAELPGAQLTVVGEGDPEVAERLRGLAVDLGCADRVELVGAVARTDLPSVYAGHDALLFPVRWPEPWGLVPLEAMGQGVPVVATALGGAAEYLRDGENALVVPPDDPAATVQAVRRLAADAGLRERLRAGGVPTAEQHTDARFHAAVRAAVDRAGT